MSAAAKLNVGVVFSLLPRVLGRESIVLCLIITGVAIAINLLQIVLLRGAGADGSGAIAILLSIAMAVAFTVLQFAAVYTADMRLGGSPVPAMEALLAGFSRLASCLGLSFLLGIIVVIGLLMLVVPGLFALLVFSLAMPALVIQKTGVFASIDISRMMTRGRRLRLLGVWLVYLIASLMVIAALLLLSVPFLVVTGSVGLLGQILLRVIVVNLSLVLTFILSGAISAVVFRLIEAEMPDEPI